MQTLPFSPMPSDEQQINKLAATSLGVSEPQVTVERKRSPSRHPQINLGDRSQRNQAWNALSRDLKHDTDSSRVGPLKPAPFLSPKVLAPSAYPSQQEEGYQRLVGKLSKRHSNVPRRENGSSKLAARFDSTVAATGGGPLHMPEALVEQDALGKEITPSSGIGGGVLEEQQVKSLSSSYASKLQTNSDSLSSFVTASSLPESRETVAPPNASLDPTQGISTLSPIALNSSKLIQRLEGSTQTEEMHMLNFSKAVDSQTGELDVNSLLSSLDQAYGFSTLVDRSKLLSTLMGSTGIAKPGGGVGDGCVGVACQSGSVREERHSGSVDPVDSSPASGLDYNKRATSIQAWYRGCVSRKKFCLVMRQTSAATRIQAMW